MTNNEPTVRYWRHVNYPDVIEGATKATHASYERSSQWVEVVVMTPAELAAIKAEVWNEGHSWGWHDVTELLGTTPHPDRADYRLRMTNPYIESEE